METTEQTSACHLIVVFIGVKLVTSEHVYPSQSVMKEQFSLLVTPSHHHQKIIVHKCNEQIKMTPSAPPPLPSHLANEPTVHHQPHVTESKSSLSNAKTA